MDIDVESLLDSLDKLLRSDGLVLPASFVDELHHFLVELVGSMGPSLLWDKSGEARLLEGLQCLVEGRARETKVRRAVSNGFLFDSNLPEHLVLDLNEIARVEELVCGEERVVDALGMGTQSALVTQGVLSGIGLFGFLATVH